MLVEVSSVLEVALQIKDLDFDAVVVAVESNLEVLDAWLLVHLFFLYSAVYDSCTRAINCNKHWITLKANQEIAHITHFIKIA